MKALAPVTIGLRRDEIIARMEIDFNFFAQVMMPEVFTIAFPPAYLAKAQLCAYAANHLEEELQIGLGLPRGYAKTTLMKLICAHAIIFSPCRYFLCVGSSQPKAENIIADVALLLGSQNCVALFGYALEGAEKNRAVLKTFTFRGKDCVLMAVGAHGDPRGINIGFKRPDWILMDDIQSRECAMSQVESERLKGWMDNTLLHTKAHYGCVSIYIGNKYNSDHCILSQLEENSDWKTLVTGAILSDMTPLWPELKPMESILRDLQRAIRLRNFAGFAAEILNDSKIRALDGFSETKMLQWKYASHEMPQAKYIVIDPSGESEESDDTGVAYFEVFDGVPWYRKVTLGKMSPITTIYTALMMGLELDCPYIFVEAVAYQKSLLFWFDFVVKQAGISGFQLHPCSPKGQSKNARILAYIRETQARNAGVHPEVMADFIFMLYKFDPSKKKNKDEVLDLGAYSVEIWAEHKELLTSTVGQHQLSSGAATVSITMQQLGMP